MRFLIESLRASIWPRPKAKPAPKPAVDPVVHRAPRWIYRDPEHGAISVHAFDRSKARAEIKKVLGLKRLPVGCTPERAR